MPAIDQTPGSKPVRPWADPSPPTPAAPDAVPSDWMTEPEFAVPYRAYARNPTPQTAGALLTASAPVLDEALRSYAGGEGRTVTARANAKRLALEAARRYDPTRAKFRTHLLSHLRGLRRVSERLTSAVYVPEQHRLDSQRLNKHLPDLRDDLGREPSDAEIADRLQIPLARVRKARTVPGVLSSSQTEGVVPMATRDEKAHDSWVDIVYHDLNNIDQVILEHSFGLHGKPVLQAQEIAQMVGLSPGAVSVRKQGIQQQLDEYDTFMGRG